LEDFAIRRLVDLLGGQVIETMNYSKAPPIAPSLPRDNGEPDVSSMDGSDTIHSDEPACLDDHFDAVAPEDQIGSPPRFDYDAAEIADRHPANIPRSISIISGILER
jgi:hypothetical protein